MSTFAVMSVLVARVQTNMTVKAVSVCVVYA